MTFELPPIVKLAQRVRLDIEQAVRGFARYHKYQVGSVLRAQALDVVSICNRAWRDRGRQLEHTGKLVFAIDDLKFTTQIAKEDKAFKSFGQFEVIAKSLVELGRQCGGWHKDQHRKSQNAKPSQVGTQRTQILSARDTSKEVSL
jgi:hypothetical protein